MDARKSAMMAAVTRFAWGVRDADRVETMLRVT
jgi:hypothetical protein